MIDVVRISREARKQLARLPKHILQNFMAWVEIIELSGLEGARKIPGYNDEALRGERKGQSSVRLSRAYRAFYRIEKDTDGRDVIEFILVLEVNKHEY